MYSSARRTKLLKELEILAKSLQAVEGMVVVGSGVHNFTDDMSDLDVIFVVDPTDELEHVVGTIADKVAAAYRPVAFSKYIHHAEVHVLCYLLEDMLELDLGVWSLARLFASKPEWKIQYSKSGSIEKKLRETSHSPPTPYQTGEELLQSLWIQARAGVVAIDRNQVFKAIAETNAIRATTLRLICESNGFAHDFERNVEKIDDPLVSRLRHSFASGTEPGELLAALSAVCDISIDAMNNAGIKVSDARPILHRLFQRPWQAD